MSEKLFRVILIFGVFLFMYGLFQINVPLGSGFGLMMGSLMLLEANRDE